MAICKVDYTDYRKTGLDFNPSIAFWHHAIKTLILTWKFHFVKCYFKNFFNYSSIQNREILEPAGTSPLSCL